jgi:ATP-dependent Zn protease
VASLLDAARDRATTLLRQNRATLDTLASELVAMEMVSGARLAEIAATAKGAVATPGEQPRTNGKRPAARAARR